MRDDITNGNAVKRKAEKKSVRQLILMIFVSVAGIVNLKSRKAIKSHTYGK